jgi:hypothetical protein
VVKKPRLETFYEVQLTGISVGGPRVPGVANADLRLDPFLRRGGVIVESGTSVTRLARPAYSARRDAFCSVAVGLRLSPGRFSLFFLWSGSPCSTFILLLLETQAVGG